ncbi:MAG TPA: peptidoglycan-binding domain-containing protein [Candidatus Bathyarchaeia archaeon]|nr:peptidoglycan-binding domain-containing protein [Candidatus Bathyarchaeia archaeon]
MIRPYNRPGLQLQPRSGPPDPLVKALQEDLRSLGYLRAGIDGQFGAGTSSAVRSLQYDLLNAGQHGSDGDAPVALRTFNQGRVSSVTGIVDERLAACIEDILDEHRVPELPRAANPTEANADALARIEQLTGLPVPRPFLVAIFLQESGGMHYRVPDGDDVDDFIVVGLDRNDAGHPDHVTSRGYGIGQYTLFHHPPTADEVATIMQDPAQNAQRAVKELRSKYDLFITGSTPGQEADDRIHEIGTGPLRLCRYAADDPRYMIDCARCAGEHLIDVPAGAPLYPGATDTLHPTQYHPETHYSGVPDRTTLGCDWPYAVRRYNGSGIDSYHYQFEVLQRLIRPPLGG